MINPIPYFESKRIDYHLPGEKNVSRGWIGIRCPFPDCGDPSWHCGINLESEMFNCYICGNKGHFKKLIVALEGCSYSEAEAILNTLDKGSNLNEAKETTSSLYKGIGERVLPLESTDFLPDLHGAFLQSRGFDPDYLITKYKLRACGNLGRYKFRIIIPYFVGGKVVTFTARDVTRQSRLSYKDCPPEESIVPVKHSLYNVDSVKDRVLIVEGPLDAWRIGDGAVATSTFNYSKQQIVQLSRLKARGVKSCFIMYDAEEKAIKKAERLVLGLGWNHMEILKLSEPGDPGEMGEGDVRHLRKELGL